MTLPSLIAKYKKNEAETYLKRFYSNINEAVRLSEIDNGKAKYWEFASDGSVEALLVWFDKYFSKYLKVMKIEQGDGYILIHLNDGSALRVTYYGHDFVYCPNPKNIVNAENILGSKCFYFGFYPDGESACRKDSFSNQNFDNKGVEPFVGCSVPDESALSSNGAQNYTKIIQLNGWKIPDDYPIKF